LKQQDQNQKVHQYTAGGDREKKERVKEDLVKEYRVKEDLVKEDRVNECTINLLSQHNINDKGK
tara:strand:+ start:1555 stop:1746 length:192 start_codon:yes stop_codon:yes gene_type:complete